MKLRVFFFLGLASTLLAGSDMVVVQKPAAATQYTEASRAHFGVWTDPQAWLPNSHPTDMFMLQFTRSVPKMNASVNAEAAVVAFESMPRRALEIGRKFASIKYDLVAQEHRMVCGKDVWFLVMEGIANHASFTSYGYYYSGPEGTVQAIVCFDTKDQRECQGPALDFLNGLQIGPPGAAPATPTKTVASAAARPALANSSSTSEVSAVASVDIQALNASVPYHSREAAAANLKKMLSGDPANLAKRLQLAVEKDDREAMYLLSGMYAKGKGVPADPARAIDLMKRAASGGSHLAEVALGSWYVSGYLVEKDWKEAERLLSKAAAAGSPDGEERLGEILLATDSQRAVELLRKAAQQEFAPAEYCLALCYASGKGVEKNPEMELQWLQRASQHGNVKATQKIGHYYWDRNGAGDQTEAVKCFARAAQTGLAEAQNDLGVCLQLGTGIPADKTEAAKWLQKAADQDYALAQANLGKAYASGVGVPRDMRQACYWMKRAASAGDAKAQAWMGLACARGTGMEKDVRGAVEWLRKAAEQNELEACYNLGVMYARDDGIPQDRAEAIKWFRKAAERGETKSQEYLGECYLRGWGVERDLDEGVKWMRRAAESGMAKAQLTLGVFYRNGNVLPKHLSEGIEWIRKAAEQGYSLAQFDLGITYSNGNGVAANQEEASRWFRFAAIHGNAKGQNAYGFCLASGTGVKQDLVEAYKWYLLAIAQDADAEAKGRAEVNKKAVLPQMTPEQIQEAERRAAAFVPEKEAPDEFDPFSFNAA